MSSVNSCSSACSGNSGKSGDAMSDKKKKKKGWVCIAFVLVPEQKIIIRFWYSLITGFSESSQIHYLLESYFKYNFFNKYIYTINYFNFSIRNQNSITVGI